MFWKSKRMKELEKLVSLLEEQVKELKKPKEIYTLVQVPGPNDQATFQKTIADFVDNPFYLFYFQQARRKATDDFEYKGKDMAEFYRGKLAAIGDIFLDARQAKMALNTIKSEQEEKE